MNTDIAYKKILPMQYPDITVYNIHANLLSMLSYDKENLSWFYNHYVQLALKLDTNNDFNWLDFYISTLSTTFFKDCPLITCHGLSREFINSNWNTFTDFIISSINSGYYLYFLIDTLYIPAYKKNYHDQHQIFVYGYDINKEIINIADNFAYGKYTYEECSFSNMKNAYLSDKTFDWMGGVILLKINQSGHKFDNKKLKIYINDYIDSFNTNTRNILADKNGDTVKYVYGLQIYEKLKDYIKKNSSNDEKIIIQPFHLLWDHKKLILSLIQYLHKQETLNRADYFYSAFSEISEKTLLLRNIILKYLVNKNKSLIIKAVDIIDDIKADEKKYFREMLDHIYFDSYSFILPQNTIIDCDNLFLEYSGLWVTNNIDSGIYYSTNIKDACIEFEFYGSSIIYIATKNENCGYADIYIDDALYDSVNLFSTEHLNTTNVFSNEDLHLGYHKIKIVCSGKKDSISMDTIITIERFIIKSYDGIDKIANEATFTGIDNYTYGNWIGSYGSKGYDIIGDSKSLPMYARVRYNNSILYIWDNNAMDLSALSKPITQQERIAAQRYSSTYCDIKLIIFGDKMKDVTLYILDYKGNNRIVQVSILDGDTFREIHSQNIQNFTHGIYLKYKLLGKLIIRITNMGGINTSSTFSGIFFD